MQRLILLRGLPGSGKSTLAALLAENATFKHFEADQFFTDSAGHYVFDGAKLADAHKWCQNSTDNALYHGFNVVVANTFSRQWEMESYKALARKHGITCNICTCENSFSSTHNVPLEVITSMRDRWEFSQ